MMKTVLVTLAACLCLVSSAAAEPVFKAVPFVESAPGRPVPWAITADKEVYSFIAPTEWTVAVNPQLRRVTLRRAESEISIVFLEAAVPTVNKLDVWVDELKRRIPNAQIVDAAVLSLAGKKAVTCDANWMTRAAIGYAGRFTRGTVGKAQIEFSFVTQELSFDSDRAAFNRVLSSFSTGIAITTARAAKLGKE
jgi:hypothetical protein